MSTRGYLAQGALVRGAVVQAAWQDIGTAEGYLQAQAALLSGEVPDVFGDASPFVRAESGPPVCKVPGARAFGTLHPPVYLDRGAVVERGAEVGPNVYLGPGVHVPAGSRLAHAALLEGSAPAGTLQHVLVWPGGRLPGHGP